MFQPRIFCEERIEIMHEMMSMHPFASLVSMQKGERVADHIPLIIHPELSAKGTLRGHVARGNPI
jgi:transcriptional regulator